MHKHRTYKRSGSHLWRNANSELPEFASKAITDLFREVDWGDDFSVEYLREQYLSKYCDEDLTPAWLRRENAVSKWRATEETNKATNAKLAARDAGYNILPRVTYAAP